MMQEPNASADSNRERCVSEIVHYHVHVYYDDATRAAALRLREQIAARFPVELGRVFEQAVGPHPTPQYQAAFEPALFDRIVPWLMLNRQGLSILIHPNTDLEMADHFTSALWLGEAKPLNGAALSVSLRAAGLWPLRALRINTEPALA